MCALAFPLSACGNDPTVVATALGPRPVDKKLMKDPALPACHLSKKDGPAATYAFEETDGSRMCWMKATLAAHNKIRALQAAVKVREQAVARAQLAAAN